MTDPRRDLLASPKAVDPKWRAVGTGIVACGVCRKEDEVIFRYRHGEPGEQFIYRCREHAGITDLTDSRQVEW